MNVLAANALALTGLVTSVTPVVARASDGTIYFSGQIILSTADPRLGTPPAPDGPVPRHTAAIRPLPKEAQVELLDYFADYMQERGTVRTQLSVKTDSYE